MAFINYSPSNQPKKGDIINWNWRGGTTGIVKGYEGKKVVIEFNGDKGRKGRAVVFPSSLRLLERPSVKQEDVA